MLATHEPNSSTNDCSILLPGSLGLDHRYSGSFASDEWGFERTKDWRKLPNRQWQNAVRLVIEWTRTLSPGVTLFMIDSLADTDACRISISVGGGEDERVVTDEIRRQFVAKLAEGLGVEITLNEA